MIDATPPGHPHRAARAATAATACLTYAEAGGPDDLLDGAVALASEAVDRTPARHPDRPTHLSGLGLAHLGRHERTGSPADAAAAVTACTGALDLLPQATPSAPRAQRTRRSRTSLSPRPPRRGTGRRSSRT